ncbi:hypothetical protein DL95DRAFT_505324 [Leptodontidium sp. 2 PMI_412]|nr:hypothetical protein DL95DRAFT_505324 [Leptodontidium sp. 2 PMI_412]
MKDGMKSSTPTTLILALLSGTLGVEGTGVKSYGGGSIVGITSEPKPRSNPEFRGKKQLLLAVYSVLSLGMIPKLSTGTSKIFSRAVLGLLSPRLPDSCVRITISFKFGNFDSPPVHTSASRFLRPAGCSQTFPTSKEILSTEVGSMSLSGGFVVLVSPRNVLRSEGIDSNSMSNSSCFSFRKFFMDLTNVADGPRELCKEKDKFWRRSPQPCSTAVIIAAESRSGQSDFQ